MANEVAQRVRMRTPVGLSVVLPAYNEADRLPPYLTAMQRYLGATFRERHQVLVVDDGSTDQLLDRIHPFVQDWPQLVVLTHQRNEGKGAAVRTGVVAAYGDLILIADADGAAPIEEEGKLRRAIAAGAAIAIGTRYRQGQTEAGRCWGRDFCGRQFARLVRLFLQLPFSDTQCGFKMFRRDVAQHLFALCREPGYAFDLELLLWARRLNYSTAEVDVSWKDVPGSKVRLTRDSWKMLRSLWQLRRCRRMNQRVFSDHAFLGERQEAICS